MVLLLIVSIIPQLRSALAEVDAPPHYQRINGYVFIPETSPIRVWISVDIVRVDTLRREVSSPATLDFKRTLL